MRAAMRPRSGMAPLSSGCCCSRSRGAAVLRRPPPPASLADAAGALAADGGASPSTAALAAGAVLGAGVATAAGRVYAYSQLEFVVAAMLTNNVPKGGGTVLQLGGGSRELYYYPRDLRALYVLGAAQAKGLLEQAGLQARARSSLPPAAAVPPPRRSRSTHTPAFSAARCLTLASRTRSAAAGPSCASAARL